MNQDKKNTSFSLLNQKEIDTLIKFLTANKNSMDSAILSQRSIDKLIMLFQTDKERLALNYAMTFGYIDASVLNKYDFRTEESEVCELCFSVNDDTQYITLTAHNQTTGKELVLTPKLLNYNEDDTEDWGRCIPPTFFNHIASALALKYTKETYDVMCSVYAEQTFGDAGHKIPEIYLLDNEALLDCLL